MSDVILDSNVFTLFLVGIIDPLNISKHRRTSVYTKKHFEFLISKINQFDNILICPNIATEVDNLLNNFSGDYRFKYLSLTKEIFKISIEKYIETSKVVDTWYYDKLGISDSAILIMAKHCDLLISGDSSLCDHARAENINVFDFKLYINEEFRK